MSLLYTITVSPLVRLRYIYLLHPDLHLGDYLGMTLPIVTVVRTDENHSVISHDVTVAYYLPTEHQAQPPQPQDSEIIIEIWPATVVYTRPVKPLLKLAASAIFINPFPPFYSSECESVQVKLVTIYLLVISFLLAHIQASFPRRLLQGFHRSH